MMRTVGKLLGVENVESIDSFSVTIAAPWAQDHAFWIFLSALALIAGSLVFYWRFQTAGKPWQRLGLGAVRGIVLALLLIMLADPGLELTLTEQQRPLLHV